MNSSTAELARTITKENSLQSYYTTRLLVDKDLEDDCFRAYAYFRWVDDVIDVKSESVDERLLFIQRQKELINRFYRDEVVDNLAEEEEIVAHLIRHDRGENSGLQSFIRNFLAILEFDAYRKGQVINEDELNWYSSCLGKSITDAIQYFIRNGHQYPEAENRYSAATAAHITHVLRDMKKDLGEGFINIPAEYLDANGLLPGELSDDQLRAWIRVRVTLAREYFQAGKLYLDSLDILRCKIAGYWYCTRFEVILDCIERDGFTLREEYDEQRKFQTLLKMAWIGISLTLRHLTQITLPSSQSVN
jgi:phytoene/squalene synthetase